MPSLFTLRSLGRQLPICLLLVAGALVAAGASAQVPAGADEALRSACAGESGARFRAIPRGVTDAAVAAARVTASDVVFDAGVGNGAFLLQAARARGASGVATAVCPAGREDGAATAARLGLGEKAVFRTADPLTADFGAASVVSLFLLPSVNAQLLPRLLRELKPGTRIISFQYDMGEWKADRKLDVDGWAVYLWTVPASSEGHAAASEQGSGSAFVRACQANLSNIVPRSTSRSCDCIEPLFGEALSQNERERLTRDFSEDNFLLASVARVDLYKKVAACLR